MLQEAGVKAHESESPPSFGLKAGAFADVGTLILTNRRLVYIMKGGGATSAAWVRPDMLAYVRGFWVFHRFHHVDCGPYPPQISVQRRA
jgi:hypothetical protein